MLKHSSRRIVAIMAVAAPQLLALNEPPSPTLLNQCASLGLMGVWVAAIALRDRPQPKQSWSLLLALAVVLACLVWSLGIALPFPIAVGSSAIVLAAVGVACAGSAAARGDQALDWTIDFAWALCLAGTLNAAIGCLQVFAPNLPDGDLIARSAMVGRAVGNLRQPNHLASLALWALISTLALHELNAARCAVVLVMGVLCLCGVVLSGSRTGMLGVVLLAIWGGLDSRLSRRSRWALIAMPLLYAALSLLVSAWTHGTAHAFSSEEHLLTRGGDVSSSRFGIWSNTLAMIAHEPLTGVGFGEFNLAWTLTEFPNRPTAFFDHAHNLPLHLWVELGVPMGSLVFVLLLASLFQAWRRAWRCEGAQGVAKRAAFMLVLMIGLHSMLEYPLWYAYFLLPTAFAWGFALAVPSVTPGEAKATATPTDVSGAPRANRTLALAGIAMTIGATAAVLDYWRVVVIYDPPERAAALEERIERGQRSPLFGHHADYAAATAFGEPKAPLSPSQMLAFKRAPHQLLDVRLMIAWAQALAAQGEIDKARWLAARVREFRNSGADEFFAPCEQPEEAAQAFQCQPPRRAVHWREFTQQR